MSLRRDQIPEMWRKLCFGHVWKAATDMSIEERIQYPCRAVLLHAVAFRLSFCK